MRILPFEAQRLSLSELIDRFNEPCDRAHCRFTSHQVNDDWCARHGTLYEEIQRRQRIWEERTG